MKPMVSTLILAAAIIVAGFVAGETSRATYAIVNAGGEKYAGFYRLNVRTGAVQVFTLDSKKVWRCAVGTDSTCTTPDSR